MRKVNIKSGFIIIIYSLILCIVLGIGLYNVKISFNNVQKNAYIKNLDIEIMINSFLNYSGGLNLKKDSINELINLKIIEQTDKLVDSYLRSAFKYLIFFIILFFFVVIVASLMLWIILNKIHNSEIEKIVKKLNEIDETFNPYNVSKSFGLAYENIKGKFKENLNDYKKLNSYLSHEQKNAISILRANLEIDGNKEYIRLLDNITQSIDDIVTLSEFKVKDEIIPIDVSLICANICDIYKKIYSNIEFSFDDEYETIILGKERWIHRAITNLVDNAVKYGNGNLISVNVESKYNSVVIKVEDRGLGMDKNFIENIFDNKYRINNLKKDGYGIGLSLVSHVCELCDGIIVVDSELGKGSSFYLSFLKYTN